MFFGYYEHSLDDKCRFVIPSKLRSEAGDVLFIMKGYDGALNIYKKEAFDKLQEEYYSHPFNKKVNRDFMRVQFASACELEIDKQGRVQIPTHLIEKYSIGRDLAIIGVGDHIEVWNRVTYLQYEKKAIATFEESAEHLEDE